MVNLSERIGFLELYFGNISIGDAPLTEIYWWPVNARWSHGYIILQERKILLIGAKTVIITITAEGYQ